MARAAPLLLLVLAACGGDPVGEQPKPPTSVFSFVVIADPHLYGDIEAATRLADCVAWVDDQAEVEGIEVVFVVGDFGSRRAEAAAILDGLRMPWVPLIGDNAIQSGQAQAFQADFAAQYGSLATVLTDWQKASLPVTDRGTGANLWLQNFAFELHGVHFLCLDWCTRTVDSILGEQADLHDVPGGTWPWFQSQVAARASGVRENVVMLSHHPMHDWMFGLGAFGASEMAAIAAFTGPYAGHLHASYGGHYHIDMDETAGAAGFEVHVTDATWDDQNTLRLVRVLQDATTFSYESDLVAVPAE